MSQEHGAMGRSEANAPDDVRVRGGVALSLWMTGAGETDCRLVARLSQRAEHLQAAVDNAYDHIQEFEQDPQIALRCAAETLERLVTAEDVERVKGPMPLDVERGA